MKKLLALACATALAGCAAQTAIHHVPQRAPAKTAVAAPAPVVISVAPSVAPKPTKKPRWLDRVKSHLHHKKDK